MRQEKGFTMFELMVVLAILSVLAAIIIAAFMTLRTQSDLANGVQEFTGVVKLAQSRTLASESTSQYGVYLNASVSPNQYILYEGASYATRIASADQVYSLPSTAEFYGINLMKASDGSSISEIVFDKLTGASEESGSVSVRLKADTTQNSTVYVSNSGTVSFNGPDTASDANRVKDSRHVQFDYSRTIDTVNESMILNFNNLDEEVIPISSILVAGELDWQGSISVGGVSQVIHVHTHRLNSPDTQFSIHRDRRYNTVSLKITLSGDSSGSLVEYSADGLTTTHPSIYVSNFAWQ